ncbi:MAG: signal peptidase I [Clostridia bacterium]|nr:signal peptidase I [Clostridia bacterium]
MNNMKLKKAIKPLKIMLSIFIMALLLYMALTAFLPKVAERWLPLKHYVIVSDSMDPDIKRGDIVIIKNPSYDKLKTDDIISFYVDANLDGNKEIVTHYIYSVELDNSGERIYRTINAKKEAPDSWSLKDADIIGQSVYTLPKIGKFMMFAQSSIGRLTMIFNLLIIIMIVYLLDYKPLGVKENKRKVKNEKE